MIEQLGQILLALRARILGGEATTVEVRTALRDAARQGGLDYDLAQVMTPDTLLMMVAPGGEVDPARCWLLAELSYLDGLEADLAFNFEEARSAFERAGFLYGMLQPVTGGVTGIPEAETRLEEIERRLEELPEPKARHKASTAEVGRRAFERRLSLIHI